MADRQQAGHTGHRVRRPVPCDARRLRDRIRRPGLSVRSRGVPFRSPGRAGPRSRRVRFQTSITTGRATRSRVRRPKAHYDRSLGLITNGEAAGKPNQLQAAGPGIRPPTTPPATSWTSPSRGRVVPGRRRRRAHTVSCTSGTRSDCFRAPSDGTIPPAPFPRRARSSAGPHGPTRVGSPLCVLARRPRPQDRAEPARRQRHTLSIFGTLRILDAKFLANDYEEKPETVAAYLGGIGRLVYDTGLPSPTGDPKHVFLAVGDHLGSTRPSSTARRANSRNAPRIRRTEPSRATRVPRVGGPPVNRTSSRARKRTSRPESRTSVPATTRRISAGG